MSYFPCNLTRNISHSIKNFFIAYSDERWLYIYYQYSLPHEPTSPPSVDQNSATDFYLSGEFVCYAVARIKAAANDERQHWLTTEKWTPSSPSSFACWIERTFARRDKLSLSRYIKESKMAPRKSCGGKEWDGVRRNELQRRLGAVVRNA